MHVAPAGDRRQDLEVGARHPRQPEQRQPRREVEQAGVLADPLARGAQPLGRTRRADTGAAATGAAAGKSCTQK